MMLQSIDVDVWIGLEISEFFLLGIVVEMTVALVAKEKRIFRYSLIVSGNPLGYKYIAHHAHF